MVSADLNRKHEPGSGCGGDDEITHLLCEWSEGDSASFEHLLPLVYDDLREIASRYLTDERSEISLQATDIVHEAYFRLVTHHRIQWQSRSHFFAIAAKIMRRFLVDHARRQLAAKRGGRGLQVPLEEVQGLSLDRPEEWLRLDHALEELAACDPVKGRIVELRFFGGLSIGETAAVVGLSRATVVRQWRLAKAWLLRLMLAGAS